MPSKVVILNDCMYCIFQNISFFLTNYRLIVPSHHCHRIVAPSHHRHRAIAPLFHRQRIIAPSHYRPTARWNDGTIVNYMVLSGFHTSSLLHYWPKPRWCIGAKMNYMPLSGFHTNILTLVYYKTWFIYFFGAGPAKNQSFKHLFRI